MRINLLALISLSVLGCGEHSTATQVGQHVFTSDVTAFALNDSGGSGLGPATPAGAPCARGARTYALTVADLHLTWSFCTVINDGTQASDYSLSTADQTLSDAEWQTLLPALQGLVTTDNTSCGADKDSVVVSLTKGANKIDYGDGFYGCDQPYTKPLLSSNSIDAASAALAVVAPLFTT
ncbi:MAG TPA: hypothetical protein VIA18_20330, partial [Polyangia bacterium]|nr:hypothetical protein [Polyangia bacterium]